MKRMAEWRLLPAVLLLAIYGTAGWAGDLNIQAFEAGSGEIVFSALGNATNYQVYTAPTPTGAWSVAVASVAPTVANAVTSTISISEATAFYRVVAMVTNTPPPIGEGLYLVVDLSGGASATSYPVTYLDAVPSDGWTNEYKTTKLVLRRIPATTPDFTMGGRSTDYPNASDFGLHQVTLTQDFYIGVFEITQRQWELVMGNKPSYFNNAAFYQTRPVEQVSYYDIREDPANSDDLAVEWPHNSEVNATSFMGRLRTKTGLSGFDLPTEAQWEYACRAGTTTALNSGYNLSFSPDDEHMNAVGRYYYNGDSVYSESCAPNAGTALVGSYLPNTWGLYDMHGNVLEWCLDWSGDYPGTVTDPKGPGIGPNRISRGGGWIYPADVCRSAYRMGDLPGYRNLLTGFRVCSTPQSQQ